MRFAACFALFGLLVSGCGSKGAVSLSAFIETLEVSATSGALGSTLGGSFTVKFEVGEEAPSGTQVSLGNFSLARDAAVIREPLAAEPVDATFPLSIAKGASRRVRFEIKETKVLTLAERDTLCQGQVSVRGAVTDTLSGGKTTPLTSAAVTPNCQ
jgi:hypothetical protein